VVQKLRAEGVKKSDLSRDAFLEHAWAWTHKHGGIILEQLKELGASCDWSRERFTMDEQCNVAVKEAFVRLSLLVSVILREIVADRRALQVGHRQDALRSKHTEELRPSH